MRPDVDDMVGRLDHVGIMLDDNDGIALVAQLLKQFIQTMHVARMQADARLIEYICNIDQTAAQVLDHLDALRLAAGQRIRLAIERQVIQPDIDKVLQPLGQRFTIGAATGSSISWMTSMSCADLHRRQLGNISAIDLATQRSLAQPGAAAAGALPFGNERHDRFLRAFGLRLTSCLIYLLVNFSMTPSTVMFIALPPKSTFTFLAFA